ncbi:MAG: alpha/beta hydrolase [Candidatus Hydrogenedentes bacterium]|nr:alpha/beta hydrolase [Candidatus Hydrogenedentota bacterium]
MKRALHVLLRALVLFAVVVVVFYVVFFFAQQPLIYQSAREVTRTPGDFGWAFENIVMPVNGETTTGWYLPMENARGTILLCHGNGGNVGSHLDVTRLFREMNFSVLIFDYGSYGESTGSPSEERVYADAKAMWDYLTKQRSLPPDSIIIWGQSFGGAAACDLASKVRPAALVLESTFTSMADAAFSNFPYFPADWFLRSHFRCIDKIGKVQSPVLIIHSIDDTQYPIAHGKALYARAPEPKHFIETRGDHYDTVPPKSRYRPQIESFLTSARAN